MPKPYTIWCVYCSY